MNLENCRYLGEIAYTETTEQVDVLENKNIKMQVEIVPLSEYNEGILLQKILHFEVVMQSEFERRIELWIYQQH